MMNKEENKSKDGTGGWNLHLDNVNSYAYWEKVFDKDECQRIIDIANKKGLITSKVGSKIEKTETIGIPKIGNINIIKKIKAKTIIILTKYLFSIKLVFSKKPEVKFLIKIPIPINIKM